MANKAAKKLDELYPLSFSDQMDWARRQAKIIFR